MCPILFSNRLVARLETLKNKWRRVYTDFGPSEQGKEAA